MKKFSVGWKKELSFIFVAMKRIWRPMSMLHWKRSLQEEGAMSAKEAADYLADMQQQKRYQRDVY